MRTTRTEEEFTQQLSALIKAEGISGLSVAQIAARLRCSRRRLYAVAPTKEGLLHFVAQAHLDRMLRQGFDAAARERAPGRALAAYLHVGVSSTAGLSQAFLRDLESSAAGRAIFDRYQHARAEGARAIVEEGIRSGEFNAHNPHVVAEALLGAALRLRQPQFLARAGLTISQAFDEAYSFILGGLLSPSRRRRAATGARPPASAPESAAGSSGTSSSARSSRRGR